VAFGPTIPLTALGATIAACPTFLVRVAGEEALASLLGGAVDPWQSMRAREGEAAPGGLFDERIFGRRPRDAGGRVRWERWADVEPRERPQALRFGRLDLPVPVVHPWVLATAEGALRRRLRRLARCEELVFPDGRTAPEDAPDDEVLFGGEAVVAKIRAGALALEENAMLRRVPVLPAGLRPIVDEGGRCLVHDLTLLYDLVCERIARLLRLREQGAPAIIARNEARLLQRAVCALFVDGAVQVTHEDGEKTWEPPEPEDEREEDGDHEKDGDGASEDGPRLRALAGYIGYSPDWPAAIDRLARAEERAFSKRWHAPPYLLRAWLEASALEVVPRGEDGAPDERALARSQVDRTARLFDDVYHEQLGPLYDRVLHGPSGDPHVDVYATGPRGDGTRLILTAGMSSAAQHDHPRQGPCPQRHLELAMVVPAGIEDALLDQVMQRIHAVARYPFLHHTHFALLHDVSYGEPIGPGSALSAFVFVEPVARDPFEALSVALPRAPRFLLALGISEAEQEGLMRGQRAAAVEDLVRRTGGVTDPGRTSLG
jgi:hypothetical protein